MKFTARIRGELLISFGGIPLFFFYQVRPDNFGENFLTKKRSSSGSSAPSKELKERSRFIPVNFLLGRSILTVRRVCAIKKFINLNFAQKVYLLDGEPTCNYANIDKLFLHGRRSGV